MDGRIFPKAHSVSETTEHMQQQTSKGGNSLGLNLQRTCHKLQAGGNGGECMPVQPGNRVGKGGEWTLKPWDRVRSMVCCPISDKIGIEALSMLNEERWKVE